MECLTSLAFSFGLQGLGPWVMEEVIRCSRKRIQLVGCGFELDRRQDWLLVYVRFRSARDLQAKPKAGTLCGRNIIHYTNIEGVKRRFSSVTPTWPGPAGNAACYHSIRPSSNFYTIREIFKQTMCFVQNSTLDFQMMHTVYSTWTSKRKRSLRYTVSWDTDFVKRLIIFPPFGPVLLLAAQPTPARFSLSAPSTSRSPPALPAPPRPRRNRGYGRSRGRDVIKPRYGASGKLSRNLVTLYLSELGHTGGWEDNTIRHTTAQPLEFGCCCGR